MTKTNSPLLVRTKKICPHVSAKTNLPAKAWSDCDETDSENTIKSTAKPLIERVELEIVDLGICLDGARQFIKPNRYSKNVWIFGKKFSYPWNIPWVMLVNSLIQILVYAFSSQRVFNLLLYSPYKKHEVWRFISYTLLHSDILHLSLNILLQFLAAFILETEQGHWQILILYLTGGFAGAVGTSIFHPKLLMVGSSAGVYSLLISHVPHLAMNFHSLRYKYFRIIALILLCSSDAGYTFIQVALKQNVTNPISIAAHLSGVYNGLLLGFIIFSRPKLRLYEIFRYTCLVLYILSMTISVIVSFKCDAKNVGEGCLKNVMVYVNEYFVKK